MGTKPQHELILNLLGQLLLSFVTLKISLNLMEINDALELREEKERTLKEALKSCQRRYDILWPKETPNNLSSFISLFEQSLTCLPT